MAILDVEKYGTIDLGRSSIDIFNEYLIIGGQGYYEGMELKTKNAISEKSFFDWVNRRKSEIELSDKKNKGGFPHYFNEIDDHKIWFKFNAFDIGKPSAPEIVYDGEGAVWLDNNVLFIAPGGAADADEKIPKMINKVKKIVKIKRGFVLIFIV